MSFSNATEVRDLATHLIEQYHQHLSLAPIEYVFNALTMKKGGKEILGQVKLVSGLNAYLITKDFESPLEQLFVMTISRSAWDLLEDNPKAREALVYHELCHCKFDLTGALSLKPHDLEEFNEVVELYGPWQTDISSFLKAAKAAKTPMLPFDILIARENQEKDSADREQREHEGEIDDEIAAAAASTGVKVVKGRKKDAERQAAAGE